MRIRFYGIDKLDKNVKLEFIGPHGLWREERATVDPAGGNLSGKYQSLRPCGI
jgi:hypothetical protein